MIYTIPLTPEIRTARDAGHIAARDLVALLVRAGWTMPPNKTAETASMRHLIAPNGGHVVRATMQPENMTLTATEPMNLTRQAALAALRTFPRTLDELTQHADFRLTGGGNPDQFLDEEEEEEEEEEE